MTDAHNPHHHDCDCVTCRHTRALQQWSEELRKKAKEKPRRFPLS